jgi:hypothetical protein
MRNPDKEEPMGKKRYRIETSCPQCGCSGIHTLSTEEIRERFGDVPNIEMECGECTIKYLTEMEKACPEWAKDCKLEE